MKVRYRRDARLFHPCTRLFLWMPITDTFKWDDWNPTCMVSVTFNNLLITKFLWLSNTSRILAIKTRVSQKTNLHPDGEKGVELHLYSKLMNSRTTGKITIMVYDWRIQKCVSMRSSESFILVLFKKIYKNKYIISPVVLHGCETPSSALMEE